MPIILLQECILPTLRLDLQEGVSGGHCYLELGDGHDPLLHRNDLFLVEGEAGILQQPVQLSRVNLLILPSNEEHSYGQQLQILTAQPTLSLQHHIEQMHR